MTTGRDLYYDRWWVARLHGICLRAWEELPRSIRNIWNNRARAAQEEN